MGGIVPKGTYIIVTDIHPSSSHYHSHRSHSILGKKLQVNWMTTLNFAEGYYGCSFLYENGRDGFCLGLKYEIAEPAKPSWEL